MGEPNLGHAELETGRQAGDLDPNPASGMMGLGQVQVLVQALGQVQVLVMEWVQEKEGEEVQTE